MNYELAKQLKDDGFPQGNTMFLIRGLEQTPTFGNAFAELKPGHGEGKFEWIACPILSELIEACGESFSSLIKKNGGWEANSKYFMKDNIANVHNWIGSSPEEAVAKLWLEINKK